jgi:membrane-associated phospholipid phosphatase
MVAEMPRKNKRWENMRAGEIDTDALLESASKSDTPSPPPKFHRLHQAEYRLLRLIQRLPFMLPPSLAVHYSLLPTVITPLLSLLVWLISLPKFASLIALVCASDCVNTALKWAVQRPRPRWYSAQSATELDINAAGAWEVDLSFPSAHTQFFSGLAFCVSALFGRSLWLAAAFGAAIGITRNYLSMHWPTDTIAGLVLGGAMGWAWASLDPYAMLLSFGSPLLSLGAATLLTVGLLSLLIATRQAVPPVTSIERTAWFANALSSLSPDERAATLANPRKQLKARNLKSKLPMLVTVWCTLAITGLYPALLPTAALEPRGPLTARLLQTGIGVVGLGAISALKRGVGHAVDAKAPLSRRDKTKGALKALTYAAICAWTFLGSQLVGGALR